MPDCAFNPSSPLQEAQKIFKANHPMDAEVTKAKVRETGCLLGSGCWANQFSPLRV